MTTALTTYRVENSRGVVDHITDTDRAEQLSDAGYIVTAIAERPL